MKSKVRKEIIKRKQALINKKPIPTKAQKPPILPGTFTNPK
jgi:hypothetical protein